MLSITEYNVAVIGLGYVGLPLAVEFAKYRDVIGFDIDPKRISELNDGMDSSNEVTESELQRVSPSLVFTSNISELSKCNFYIISVPTPIDNNNHPDLSYLISASKLVGSIAKKGDFIVFESTVYPGATREVCIEALINISGLELNKDFFVGYSPERINPGDKERGLADIVKITSGSNEYAANIIDSMYSQIIKAGTYQASSIEVAEAAKVIENTQRDLNIALVNELALIFNKMNIDTKEVIDAASTKWNFATFYPGLVGGHCIGVDPYYLTHRAKELGYIPKVILSGRELNDSMPHNVALILEQQMMKTGLEIKNSTILILGFTFKENCPDIRNSKVADLALSLQKMEANVSIHDPVMDQSLAIENYPNFHFSESPNQSSFDAVIVAVAHSEYISLGINKIKDFLKDQRNIIFDLKSTFDHHSSNIRL